MRNLPELSSAGVRSIEETLDRVMETIATWPEPEVLPLTRRTATQMTAAVAVDAGQSLFSGVLKMLGIAVFQVASSLPDEEPTGFVLYADPWLDDAERRCQITAQLEVLFATHSFLGNFFTAGWNNLQELVAELPAGGIDDFSAYFRDFLEWAALYRVGQEIRTAVPWLRPVLLRDGTLRFAGRGERYANRLRHMFEELGNQGVHIVGITKQTAALRSPLVWCWLERHGVFARDHPFAVPLYAEILEEVGLRWLRYYGEGGHRFGRYHLVRFDPQPYSRFIFAVDVPDYICNRGNEAVILLLSGIAQHATATAFPVPGYPMALRQAHDKVVLNADRVRWLESILRTSLNEEVYSLICDMARFEQRRVT